MTPTELESLKKSSTAQLLMRCGRLMNDAGVARVREHFGVPIRAAHTLLFPHIDLKGTRLTELARRLGITKQAVSQLVLELEEMGVLQRLPDPHDGRAKLVCFVTGEGQLGIASGVNLLLELERELSAEVGADTMTSLHEALTRLLPVLERER